MDPNRPHLTPVGSSWPQLTPIDPVDPNDPKFAEAGKLAAGHETANALLVPGSIWPRGPRNPRFAFACKGGCAKCGKGFMDAFVFVMF
eukprot:10747873-Lingulodinium_polyedra.AAC.1